MNKAAVLAAALFILGLPGCDERDQPREHLFDAPAVLVSLPASRSVVLLDPAGPSIRRIIRLDTTSVNGPYGSANGPTGVIVVGGSSPAGIARLSLASGAVSSSRVLSAGFKAHEPVFGLDGSLYVSGDTGPVEKGLLLKVHPQTLEEVQRVEIGLGQGGVAVGRDGRIWTIGNAGYGKLTHSFSVVDAATMRATIKPLAGGPTGIAAGPDGAMFVPLYFRNEVVELLANGRVGRRLSGVGFHPRGIDIAPSGVGIVVTEGSPTTPSAAYAIDFSRLRVLRKVRIQPPCKVAREVEILGPRAFVTCSGPPRILMLELPSLELGRSAELAPVVRPRLQIDYEQPRGLLVIPDEA